MAGNLDKTTSASSYLDAVLTAEDAPATNNVLTSAISYRPSEHCDMRCKQRGISEKDLKRAKKHGVKSDGPWGGTIRYTFEDITYIVDRKTGIALTTWAKPLQLKPVKQPKEAYKEHQIALLNIRLNKEAWKSNSVFVVDTSGSMSKGDIWGTRSRLAAVWLCLARDYIAQGLNNGDKGPMDVVTVLTLSENPTCIIKDEPWTWTLYNRIVSLYRSNEVKAENHGPFLPALKKARKILIRNPSRSHAVALYFLSDGVPSDVGFGSRELRDEAICTGIRDISRTFGSRLTFFAVGLGDLDRFDILENMVHEAKDFGVNAEFLQPALTATSLGETITSALNSLSTTQTRMTDMDTLEQRTVRKTFREGKSEASKELTEVSPWEFFIYGKDQISRSIYREWFDENRKLQSSFDPVPLQHPDAEFVAMSKGAFDEGGERFAYRFYELGADGKTILGCAKVAKESLYVLRNEDNDHSVRESFVKKFCSTQQLARRLATEFNDVLGETHRVAKGTPTVSILDCSIYELNDIKKGKQWVLVEDRLDVSKWHKWNCNNGYVEGMTEKPEFEDSEIRHAMRNLATLNLGMIEECEEDEEEDDGEEDSRTPNGLRKILFTPSQVAQAFSHFTYWKTGRKRLVCDLQGVFQEDVNVLVLTDPVIHYYDPSRQHRRRVHGETDRGGKGFIMFFETHKEHCNHLCKLTTRGLRPRRQQPNRRHEE